VSRRLSLCSPDEKESGSAPTAEEEAEAAEAVVEFIRRVIVMRSLPGWIKEIYAEHMDSTHSISRHR
jgi:hypothetical protein